MQADATLWRGSIQKLFEVRFWPEADLRVQMVAIGQKGTSGTPE